MKITVMSDSHGIYENMEKVISLQPNSDLYVFLGDGLKDAEYVFDKHKNLSLLAVRGNWDWAFNNYTDYACLNLDGYKVSLCHGHLYDVRSSLSHLAEFGKENGISLCLYGHTHVPLETKYENVTLFNPGALRDGSFGVVYIEKGGILTSHGQL